MNCQPGFQWFSRAAAVALVACAVPAAARGPFVGALPNGSVHSCKACHTEASGGSPLNAFGTLTGMRASTDAGLSNNLDWRLWSRVDSDMDGFTNGQELGDPCGTWVPGDVDPAMTTVGNPGEGASLPVGAPAACTTEPGSSSSSSGGGGGPGCGNASLAPAGISALLAHALVTWTRRRRARR